MGQRQIESIAIERLIAHPSNPNRMSEVTFKKLLSHIKRAGNYEPIIVRPHPQRRECFEIINGHHRTKALENLGYKEADCIVWQVDDDEVLILLATLNRLAGGDELDRKSELIKKLSRRFSSKELVKMLPDNAKSIERLSDLTKPLNAVNLRHKAFLNPVVFFLSDEQKQIVDDAIASAVETRANGTAAQKRAWAIVTILREAKR